MRHWVRDILAKIMGAFDVIFESRFIPTEAPNIESDFKNLKDDYAQNYDEQINFLLKLKKYWLWAIKSKLVTVTDESLRFKKKKKEKYGVTAV